MKLSDKQVFLLQAGIGVALIVGVVGLATCLNHQLPRPADVTENLGKFVRAQDAYERAARICFDCHEELAQAEGFGGGLVTIHPCLLECMKASEEAAQAADDFAGAVVDAGAK